MKKKVKEELRNKTSGELEKEITSEQEGLMKVRMDLKVGKIKNTSSLKTMSDKLAIMKTILREKQFEAVGVKPKSTNRKKGV